MAPFECKLLASSSRSVNPKVLALLRDDLKFVWKLLLVGSGNFIPTVVQAVPSRSFGAAGVSFKNIGSFPEEPLAAVGLLLGILYLSLKNLASFAFRSSVCIISEFARWNERFLEWFSALSTP